MSSQAARLAMAGWSGTPWEDAMPGISSGTGMDSADRPDRSAGHIAVAGLVAEPALVSSHTRGQGSGGLPESRAHAAHGNTYMGAVGSDAADENMRGSVALSAGLATALLSGSTNDTSALAHAHARQPGRPRPLAPLASMDSSERRVSRRAPALAQSLPPSL